MFSAQHWFEKTRGLSGFNITKKGEYVDNVHGYVRRGANAAAVSYYFPDGSRLRVGRCNKNQVGRNVIGWHRPGDGFCLAERILWE